LVSGWVAFAACGGDDSSFGGTEGTGAGNVGGDVGTGATMQTGGSPGTGGMPEPECPYTGPPPIDPSTLPQCPMCAGGARCVPASLVPPENLDDLADCDANNKCVPDDLIISNGLFIPDTCDSIAGGEGRCLSECIPQVADQAALLPQSTCPQFQRCVPCYDPITAEETGSCSLSCDPGPTAPPVQLPGCCDGVGTCVPKALAGAQGDSLPQDSCPMDANDYVCAPTVFITDPNYAPPACLTEIFLFGGEPGVCLPSCIVTGTGTGLLGQSTCQNNEKCAPCNDPFSGDPTGACM
jgi:hypothetical protein